MASSSTHKFSPKQESEICLSCGECCRRYWITVLPSEAKPLAKGLGMGEKSFLEKNCLLFVKFFPKSTPGVLTVPTAFLPKKVFDLLKKEMGAVPGSFFVVPQVVLRREGKECSLLGKKNACKVYKARPVPCKLFPFIAVPGYKEQYPFCPLFRKTSKDLSSQSDVYFRKIQKYFKAVNDKGFSGKTGVWKNSPVKGIMLLNEKQLGEISLEELGQLLQTTLISSS